LFRPQRLSELTEREREVMQLVIEGRPNKLIADALDISVRTVEVHRSRVFDKMNVKSAVELANLLRDSAGAGRWPANSTSSRATSHARCNVPRWAWATTARCCGVAPGMQLAVSCDMLVEGRHFLSTVAPERLGHKALGRQPERPGRLRRRALGLHAGAGAAACRRCLCGAAGAAACWRWPTRTALNSSAATPLPAR
jgi:DNA-binding CsgD family transcriptional regulator